MNESQFKRLSKEDQAGLIINGASFIDSIHYYNEWVNLYSYRHLFIEAYYEEDNIDILKIEVVKGDAIEKYLDMISLNLLI